MKICMKWFTCWAGIFSSRANRIFEINVEFWRLAWQFLTWISLTPVIIPYHQSQLLFWFACELLQYYKKISVCTNVQESLVQVLVFERFPECQGCSALQSRRNKSFSLCDLLNFEIEVSVCTINLGVCNIFTFVWGGYVYVDAVSLGTSLLM